MKTAMRVARPLGLANTPAHGADNLEIIKGVGPQNAKKLHELGIWTFAQIAAWTPENVRWVGAYMAFPGRIDREHWVQQAADLAKSAAPNR